MNDLKIGDVVICVDASASFRRLTEGGEYQVTAAHDGTPTVEVNGAYHMLERFILKGA